MSKKPDRKNLKESVDDRHIREFINHVCNGNLAHANASLDSAVKEKVKTLVKKNLVKEN